MIQKTIWIGGGADRQQQSDCDQVQTRATKRWGLLFWERKDVHMQIDEIRVEPTRQHGQQQGACASGWRLARFGNLFTGTPSLDGKQQRGHPIVPILISID